VSAHADCPFNPQKQNRPKNKNPAICGGVQFGRMSLAGSG
jgi:hypothetical protein